MRRLALPSLLLLTAIACSDAPSEPAVDTRTAEQKLLEDYVALGSSIAAGYISGGITASTQQLAYPSLLANAAVVTFAAPLIGAPGCPAPWIAPLTPSASTGCSARQDATTLANLGNLAIPGQTVAEALSTGGLPNLQTLFVGSVSQVQAMQTANPTFVSVHLGDNDVVRAALAGSTALITPTAAFQTSYTAVVAAVAALPRLKGAVLVGVTNPVLGAPLLQPGAFFFLTRDAQGRFQGKTVNANCSPVNALGQPNPLAANLVSGGVLLDATVTEISCDAGASYVLTAAEQGEITQAVTAFNAIISAAAQARNYAYVDPNTLITQALAQRDGTGSAAQLRKCQDLGAAATAAQFQAAVLRTCPSLTTTDFFGSIVSFDGLHPSADGHARVARLIAAAIDAKYATTLAAKLP